MNMSNKNIKQLNSKSKSNTIKNKNTDSLGSFRDKLTSLKSELQPNSFASNLQQSNKSDRQKQREFAKSLQQTTILTQFLKKIVDDKNEDEIMHERLSNSDGNIIADLTRDTLNTSNTSIKGKTKNGRKKNSQLEM